MRAFAHGAAAGWAGSGAQSRRLRAAVGVPWLAVPNDPPYANNPAVCVSACAELRRGVHERATQCTRAAPAQGTGGGPLLDPY